MSIIDLKFRVLKYSKKVKICLKSVSGQEKVMPLKLYPRDSVAYYYPLLCLLNKSISYLLTDVMTPSCIFCALELHLSFPTLTPSAPADILTYFCLQVKNFMLHNLTHVACLPK